MSLQDVVRRIVEVLDEVGIPYMLTGSVASSYYGSPRTTQDIDVVIAPDAEQISAFVQRLPNSEYYADETAALDALRREAMFNVIDFATGWKVDFIIRKSRDFSRTEFDRRTTRALQGIKVAIASPEDLVIAKLEWASIGESERQIGDAAEILRSNRSRLDTDYILTWVERLGLSEQWRKAVETAGDRP